MIYTNTQTIIRNCCSRTTKTNFTMSQQLLGCYRELETR